MKLLIIAYREETPYKKFADKSIKILDDMRTMYGSSVIRCRGGTDEIALQIKVKEE